MTFQELRKQERWSRPALAEKLHIDQSTIAKWEKGISSPKSWSIYEKLAKILGTDPTTIARAIEAHKQQRS